jgi:hypothetical protein
MLVSYYSKGYYLLIEQNFCRSYAHYRKNAGKLRNNQKEKTDY